MKLRISAWGTWGLGVIGLALSGCSGGAPVQHLALYTIQGQVISPKGGLNNIPVLLPGAQVQVNVLDSKGNPGGTIVSGLTDSQGVYRLEDVNLQPSQQQLIVHAEGTDPAGKKQAVDGIVIVGSNPSSKASVAQASGNPALLLSKTVDFVTDLAAAAIETGVKTGVVGAVTDSTVKTIEQKAYTVSAPQCVSDDNGIHSVVPGAPSPCTPVAGGVSALYAATYIPPPPSKDQLVAEVLGTASTGSLPVTVK